MMKCLLWVVVMFVFFMSSCSIQGLKFNVGGRDGWVTHPSEDYNHWAQRLRFQVNDTLLFEYNKANDSVLVVTKENYNTCNTKDPIKTLSDVVSEYKFERSGPHYFISGNVDHCKQGQKLIIVVLAVRPKKSPPKPAAAPVPVPALAPAPVVSPTPAPVPSTATPPAPASQSPTPAPSTAADIPAPTPAQEKSVAPRVAVGGVLISLALGVGVILGM